MIKKLIIYALGCAAGEAIYILLVATFMINANKFFGNQPGFLGFISFLLLFVFSATISGTLILGKPILLYLDNKKTDALKLFGFTLGWLFVFLIIAILINLIF